jgi:hypothetical protein
MGDSARDIWSYVFVPDWHVKICIFSNFGPEQEVKAPFLVMSHNGSTYWASDTSELGEIVAREAGKVQELFAEPEAGPPAGTQAESDGDIIKGLINKFITEEPE